MSENEPVIKDKTETELPTIPRMRMSKEHKERIRKVRDLYFIRGWDKEEIAEGLKVKVITVERDIHFIKQFGKKLAQIDIEYRNDALNFLFELQDNYKGRVKHLWQDYDKAREETTKVAIMRELREQEKQYFEFLQSLGIMPKEAEKFLMGIKYVSHLREDIPKTENTDLIEAAQGTQPQQEVQH